LRAGSGAGGNPPAPSKPVNPGNCNTFHFEGLEHEGRQEFAGQMAQLLSLKQR
jgi:hypothetical protein